LVKPRAVFFDLDATLVDTDAAARAGVVASGALAASLYGVAPDEWAAANGRAFAEHWAIAEADWVAGRADPAVFSRAIGLRSLALTGGSADLEPQLSAAFDEGMRAAAVPFPDVDPVLRALERASIRVGIITNSVPATQRALLAALGLDGRFDTVVISGEHGVAKPDPEVFQIGLDGLGIPASEAWHVGDNPATDVAGAIAAGLSAVWLNRPGRPRASGEAVPTFEVRSLRELIPLVA
jgi:putative hydrolase of the HAD superfamily